MNKIYCLLFLLLLTDYHAGANLNMPLPKADAAPLRIITLGAAISETVYALGYGSRIVATDVTSLYPQPVKQLPKVSRNRILSAEALLSFRPDLVLAPDADISKEIRYQLKMAGIKLITFKQQFNTKGALEFIRQVSMAVGNPAKGEELVKRTESALLAAINQVKTNAKRPKKVLFIYARGAGTMTVAGKGSNMDAIISLSGGINAVKEFAEFKPYSTEMMVKTNPDVILLFDFGLNSLGGTKAVLEMPGVSGTNAGRNKNIVQVDGPLMVNFSTRLPEAIKVLNERIYP
ncbi:heme/hemin ABC transporter substrate-binding protein [Pedobacter metabolipauper]|uniref:Iron complex transport system substrate-binding protein n=1 Tax=Pedobacter metabolipauper TaxID=425513 RepID=A0A4R6SVA4_9SPHI|nr:ABC transporter substrate-binding protein [Pedobacter metabolipauper]TDQ09778.1 iron complex transport system substrate-binding protein [Pedobacter metabolipauper]